MTGRTAYTRPTKQTSRHRPEHQRAKGEGTARAREEGTRTSLGAFSDQHAARAHWPSPQAVASLVVRCCLVKYPKLPWPSCGERSGSFLSLVCSAPAQMRSLTKSRNSHFTTPPSLQL